MTSFNEFNEIKSKILNLPQDWWQSYKAALTSLQFLKKHIIPLFVVGYVGQGLQYTIYTGILLRHGDIIIWLTAGHAIDELKKLLANSYFKLSNIAWLDNYEISKAENIKLHRIDIPMKSWCEFGFDIGAILPSSLDVGNLLRNDQVETIDAGVWRNVAKANIEGYYAIGYPKILCQHTKKYIPINKILHSVTSDLVCLPLKEISPPKELIDNPLWSDQEAFYGQVLPYTDYPEFDINSTKGMSGGPIFSVERGKDGRIGYRLIGVIQSYAYSQCIFRAEPVQRVAETINNWLEEMNIAESDPKHILR